MKISWIRGIESVYIVKNIKVRNFIMAAILESAITEKVPGWRPINSVIFHVQVALNSNQVKISPNTKMYTGPMGRYRTKERVIISNVLFDDGIN